MSTPDPTDTSPAANTRSSVLFNLGVLQEQVRQNTESTNAIPGRVMDVVGPRLVAVEALAPRVTSLEQERWLTRGGITVVVVLIGWIVAATKPIALHLGVR